jgi:hypothetical protein
VAVEGFILDASPLILLARIGALDLLGQLAPRVVVPAAVLVEAQAGPREWELPSLSGMKWLQNGPDRSLPVVPQAYPLVQELTRKGAYLSPGSGGQGSAQSRRELRLMVV